MRKSFMLKSMMVVLLVLLAQANQTLAQNKDPKKPNIVYMMSDELAYYEVSHMGNPYLKTPRIDKMAAEGLRFTQALAGAPVCGPLRCTLMTGKHMGHASVRRNDGGTPLRAGEETIASVLKTRGYATGGFGKWGAGGRGSTGVPEKHGFDVFYGYYDQVHAHSFYPPYLIRNSEEVILPGNTGGRSGKTYSQYSIMAEGLKFIRANKDKPFFCYLPITPPHGMYDIPDSDPAWKLFKDKDWPQDAKRYAAMVKMVDRQLGDVLDLLKELGLEENTIVFFAGDNGGQDRFRTKDHPRGFFGPNVNPKTGVEFRGGKGNLYEGGLRIPSIVRWPGKIKAGQVSDLLWYQPDLLPTLAHLTGATAPKDIDGISILPELLGEDAVGQKQQQHEYLYWEYGSQVAVRMKNWKAIQPKPTAAWELYDLDKDISEKNNIAADHPDVLARMKAYAKAAHTPVQPGTFADRTLHEKDRRAKYGAKGPPKRNKPKSKGKANKLPKTGLISNKDWKIVRASSESESNGKLAANAIDGDPHTIWHSRFSGAVAKHPHELVIDLGSSKTVTGFWVLARQDGGWNGAVAKCEFFVGDDPKQLGKADSNGDVKAIVKATLTKTRKAQQVKCQASKGRYVMMRILSEVNGGPWASVAELGVAGE